MMRESLDRASMGKCPNSPAADRLMPPRSVGTSTTVTCTPARSRSAAGSPYDEDPWEWTCGFYPGSHPGEHQNGTAATFDEARVDFESAWRVFLSNRTEADFQAWRDQRDWTAKKKRCGNAANCCRRKSRTAGWAAHAARGLTATIRPAATSTADTSIRLRRSTEFGADRPAKDGMETTVRRSDTVASRSAADGARQTIIREQ